jgi:RNA polymerase sigma factor (sigma-70 family)
MVKRNKQDETSLIQKVLDGDQNSEQLLYEMCGNITRKYLFGKYSHYQDIDDDVSEIVIKIFNNLTKYNPERSKFSTWVIVIAKNHVIDNWKRNTYATTSGEYDFIGEHDGSLCTDTTLASVNSGGTFYTNNVVKYNEFDQEAYYDSYSTSCQAANIDNCSSVKHIIGELSASDFTMLNMKYVEGYTYCEIGTEFNITSETASNKVNYVKSKLKKKNTESISFIE